MDLTNVQSERLLPHWMCDDAYDVALTGPMDEAAEQVYEVSRLLTIWDKITQLPEGVLDELADALHIEWYDTGAPLETKQELILKSDLVHAKKGTVAAVESVITAYFGQGRVMEWPEYNGDPHHFKVYTTEPNLVGDNLTKFMDQLRKVKRHSSKLDSIFISLTGEQYIYAGEANRDYAHEMHAMGDDTLHLFGGLANMQSDNIRVNMFGGAPWERSSTTQSPSEGY